MKLHVLAPERQNVSMPTFAGLRWLATGDLAPLWTRVRDLSATASVHPLFSKLNSLGALRTYMEYHVWCVWDFMVLARSLRDGLENDAAEWLPSAYPGALSEILEILRSEETDKGPDGRLTSHFEVFVAAMRAAGADCGPIDGFMRRVAQGATANEAMRASGAQPASLAFVNSTLADSKAPVHCRASVFHYARESLVPRMLDNILSGQSSHPENLSKFIWYLKRHVELDFSEHSDATGRILNEVLGLDPGKAHEALTAAEGAIRARLNYLDAIERAV